MKTSTFSIFAGLIAVAPSLVTSVPLFNETISIWSKRAPGPAPVQELAVDTGLESRATAQAAPHWVVYWDQWVNGENGPPAVSRLKVRTQSPDHRATLIIDNVSVLFRVTIHCEGREIP